MNAFTVELSSAFLVKYLISATITSLFYPPQQCVSVISAIDLDIAVIRYTADIFISHDPIVYPAAHKADHIAALLFRVRY